jgi:hypothetical protein
MANPLAGLFGQGGSGSAGASPMMLLQAAPQMPAAPPPIQSPVGNPSTNKPAMQSSYVSSAAPVPPPAAQAPKTLLGQ